jgi:hypothetical protein
MNIAIEIDEKCLYYKTHSLLEMEVLILNELLVYANMIKEILDRDYGKEVVFYDNGEWYSRDHCRNISLEELKEYVLKVTNREEYYE